MKEDPSHRAPYHTTHMCGCQSGKSIFKDEMIYALMHYALVEYAISVVFPGHYDPGGENSPNHLYATYCKHVHNLRKSWDSEDMQAKDQAFTLVATALLIYIEAGSYVFRLCDRKLTPSAASTPPNTAKVVGSGVCTTSTVPCSVMRVEVEL